MNNMILKALFNYHYHILFPTYIFPIFSQHSHPPPSFPSPPQPQTPPFYSLQPPYRSRSFPNLFFLPFQTRWSVQASQIADGCAIL